MLQIKHICKEYRTGSLVQKALLKEKTDIANEQKRLLEEKDREIARLKEQLERIKHPV